MANGRIALAGVREIRGNYNAAPAIGDLLAYVVDTVLGSAFTIAQYGNMCSILLPRAGIWRVRGQVNRAALASETSTSIAVSIYTGNTTTDHQLGRNNMNLGEVAAAVVSGSVEDYISVATANTVTVYLKAVMGGAVGDKLTGMLICQRLFDLAT